MYATFKASYSQSYIGLASVEISGMDEQMKIDGIWRTTKELSDDASWFEWRENDSWVDLKFVASMCVKVLVYAGGDALLFTFGWDH